MNRIDRITAILIHLQTKRIVKAEEIADRFAISKRTVYRDLKALEEAGVPLGAEAGKGYFIIEGYHLPPVMFTKEEAISMLIAGKFIEKFTDNNTKNSYSSALFKIRSVLSSAEKEYLEDLYPHVKIMYSPGYKNEGNTERYIRDIQDAIVEKNVLKIDYYSSYKQELTKCREIEPIGLCYYGFTWHLIAYCRMREGFRDFRTDRIKKLDRTSHTFIRGKTDTIDNYFNNLIQTTELEEFTLIFSKKVYNEMHTYKYYYGFIDEKDFGERVEMKFMNNSITYMAKWIVNFGKEVEIISPKKLKDKVMEYVEELKLQYL